MPAPAKTKQPQDHKPRTNGARAEKRDSVSVDFEGTTYTVTRDLVDNLDIYERIEDGKAITACRAFLGPDQWATLKKQCEVDGRPSVARFNDFLNELMEAIGGN